VNDTLENVIDFSKELPLGTDGCVSEHETWARAAFDRANLCLKGIRDEAKRLQTAIDKKDFSAMSVEYSNIIAFTGDRGTGKTTAMRAYYNKLLEIKKDSGGDEKSYTALPMVDPSRMNDGETLLGIVIAGLYDKIKELAEKDNDFEKNKNDFRKAANDCAGIMKKIRVKAVSVTESLKDSDPHDYVEDFSKTIQLRRTIYELVKSYLKLRKVEQLIIPIDDLDTNISSGFEITRDIHHYLSLPNIIIIMSVKLEQLSDLVEQHYIKNYKDLIAQHKRIDTQPAEMAIKYLQKALPVTHRIPMAQLHLHTLRNVKVILPPKPRIPDGPQPLVDAFIRLVYNKTGILLVKDASKSHALIPLNLRALHHAFKLLLQLKDVDMDNLKDVKEVEKLRRNLHQVEQWLIESISSNAVPHELAEVFRQAAVHPSTGFCAFLAHQFKHYNQKLKSEKKLPVFGAEDSIHNIFNADKPDQTICLGDILFLLDHIMERDSTEGYRHFAAAIKMLISLRITSYLWAAPPENADKAKDNPEKIKHEPDYKSVSRLLGKMVVHPEVRLTATGREWLARGNLSSLRIGKTKTDKTGVHLNNEPPEGSEKLRTPVNIDTVQWLSMFLVTPYRVEYNDYHKPYMRAVWSEKLPFYVSPNKVLSISVHWMRFITAALEPEKEVERLIWMLPYKGEYIDKLKDRELPLPLHSIDVIHALTTEMNKNRYGKTSATLSEAEKKRQDEARKDKGKREVAGIYKAEFNTFKDHLFKSFESVLDNTILKEDEEKFNETRTHLVKCLNDYPLFKVGCEKYLDELEKFDVFRVSPI
jgi:hypothetical protein